MHHTCYLKAWKRLQCWRLCCKLYHNMVAVRSAHLLGALKEHVGLYAVQEQFHGNVGLGTVLTLVI